MSLVCACGRLKCCPVISTILETNTFRLIAVNFCAKWKFMAVLRFDRFRAANEQAMRIRKIVHVDVRSQTCASDACDDW